MLSNLWSCFLPSPLKAQNWSFWGTKTLHEFSWTIILLWRNQNILGASSTPIRKPHGSHPLEVAGQECKVEISMRSDSSWAYLISQDFHHSSFILLRTWNSETALQFKYISIDQFFYLLSSRTNSRFAFVRICYFGKNTTLKVWKETMTTTVFLLKTL